MITQNQDDAPCFRFDDVRLEHLRNENHWLRQQLQARADLNAAEAPMKKRFDSRFDLWDFFPRDAGLVASLTDERKSSTLLLEFGPGNSRRLLSDFSQP